MYLGSQCLIYPVVAAGLQLAGTRKNKARDTPARGVGLVLCEMSLLVGLGLAGAGLISVFVFLTSLASVAIP